MMRSVRMSGRMSWRMSGRISEASLRERLLVLTMLTSAIGMALGYTAFFLYDEGSLFRRKNTALFSTRLPRPIPPRRVNSGAPVWGFRSVRGW